MNSVGFRYDVHIELEFSGQELLILRELSHRHYDSWCKSVSQHKGFLFGWINRFILVIDHQENSDKKNWEPAMFDGSNPEEFLKLHSAQVVRLTVSSDELDTVNKLLEVLETAWATEKSQQETAQKLWWDCKQAFKNLQQEYRQANETQPQTATAVSSCVSVLVF